MRRHVATTFALLLLLGAAALGAQDWKGRGRLQGIVSDADKNPIEGAKVTMYLGEEGQGPEPICSDKKGRWSILGLATGDWTFVIEADGYKAAEGVINVISESIGPGQTLRVTLNPIPKEVLEAAEGPDPRAMIERGNALLMEQKYAESRAEYEKAIAEIEEVEYHVPILRAVANTYYAEGNAEEAIATLEKALAISAEDQESLKLLVTLLVNEDRDEEAQQYQARIVGEFKLDPNTLLNKGIEAFNAGDTAAAGVYFEQVVAENPELPDAYYYRALVYLNQGKTEEAKADFQKLLELAPSHPKAAEAQEFLEAL